MISRTQCGALRWILSSMQLTIDGCLALDGIKTEGFCNSRQVKVIPDSSYIQSVYLIDMDMFPVVDVRKGYVCVCVCAYGTNATNVILFM